MIFGGNFFLILPFFFLLKSDNTIRAANVVHFDLRGEYHKLIEDNLENNTVVLAIDIAKYDILIEYFKADPKACLAEVNEIGDYAFDELFFKVIWRDHTCGIVMIFSDPQVVPLDILHIQVMGEKLIKMAISYLFTPYRSETEMTEGFKIIEILFKFMKRHKNLLLHFPPDPSDELFELSRKSVASFPKRIDDLKFVMRTFSFDFPNGTIDYIQFLILFSRLGKISLKGYDENQSGYYLLLATHLHNIIKRRDFTLYESKYPELPLLICFILNNVDSLILTSYYPLDYYTVLKNSFINRGYSKLAWHLSNCIKSKEEVIKLAKEKLGLENCSECSISHIIEVSEGLGGIPNDEDSFILWQLKGLEILERTLKKSGYRRGRDY